MKLLSIPQLVTVNSRVNSCPRHIISIFKISTTEDMKQITIAAMLSQKRL